MHGVVENILAIKLIDKHVHFLLYTELPFLPSQFIYILPSTTRYQTYQRFF